ncbi:MAG: hypothetical protein ABI689_12215 [Thermoanaerobaculia bacterium]
MAPRQVWIAEMLRRQIMPTGHIYPRETRPLRDLLRRRARLVRNRKNGNPYLSWAFSEAAEFARRFQPEAHRFFELRGCAHAVSPQGAGAG